MSLRSSTRLRINQMTVRRRPNADQVGGGLAGVTGGTSFLALISLFPENSAAKQIAQFAAPTLTVVLSLTWAFALRWLKVYFADKQIRSRVEEGRKRVHENCFRSKNCAKDKRRNAEESGSSALVEIQRSYGSRRSNCEGLGSTSCERRGRNIAR